MSTGALRPCLVPKCPEFAGPRGRCQRHSREHEHYRGSSTARGYGKRWQALAKRFKQNYPLCGMRPDDQQPVMSACYDLRVSSHGKLGIVAADVVDHVVPHKGDRRLMWDEHGNLQSLCFSCHGRKSAAGL
jgi:5-methylcytosine-specific restriction protein A